MIFAVLTLCRQTWARFILLGLCLVFAGVHLWRLIEKLPAVPAAAGEPGAGQAAAAPRAGQPPRG
ncbi:hypothetical protein N8J89_38140 [Crossiella sp. CA-258035]|uniref:hypothetical protein n=1 Tax=Crossiella sp. CA-258035 TaxID=2981138 RepID=UPI0024BC38A6|nr:hypothetical protein [Crossiella sp. CA-258035]WHT18862.1 hypothetical protein N8J89_38140 [Crossiella sp. CA-258035]